MKKFRGWTIYIMECADGTYHVGHCRDIARELMEIYSMKGTWFTKHPERLPVKIVYTETHLPYKECYAKYLYARDMNRYLKEKLIRTNKWPNGGSWKIFKDRGKIEIIPNNSGARKEKERRLQRIKMKANREYLFKEFKVKGLNGENKEIS